MHQSNPICTKTRNKRGSRPCPKKPAKSDTKRKHRIPTLQPYLNFTSDLSPSLEHANSRRCKSEHPDVNTYTLVPCSANSLRAGTTSSNSLPHRKQFLFSSSVLSPCKVWLFTRKCDKRTWVGEDRAISGPCINSFVIF